jgi:hypothetical protein
MPDLVMERNGQLIAIQVGRRNAGNLLPVARERRAIQDLQAFRDAETGNAFLHIFFLGYSP